MVAEKKNSIILASEFPHREDTPQEVRATLLLVVFDPSIAAALVIFR